MQLRMGFKLETCTPFIVAAVSVALAISTTALWLGSDPRPLLPAKSSLSLSSLLSPETDPRFMLPGAESLRVHHFAWSSSLDLLGWAHRARSNRPFVVSWGLYRRLISAARAAHGDAALTKAVSRWRRSVKLVVPSVQRGIWTYTDLGAVSAMSTWETAHPRWNPSSRQSPAEAVPAWFSTG